MCMADLPEEIVREEILAYLMTKDTQQPRDEPEIAANIHAQLQHMGLSTWSISVHRRLRDAVARLRPSTVLEVGASIGHRTAWLLDQFERADARPATLTLVEQGGKFGVILQRLLQRYEAMSWASVVVGEPEQLAAEHQAWQLAAATNQELSQTPFEREYDVIVIDAPSPNRASLVASYLPFSQKTAFCSRLNRTCQVARWTKMTKPAWRLSTDSTDGLRWLQSRRRPTISLSCPSSEAPWLRGCLVNFAWSLPQ